MSDLLPRNTEELHQNKHTHSWNLTESILIVRKGVCVGSPAWFTRRSTQVRETITASLELAWNRTGPTHSSDDRFFQCYLFWLECVCMCELHLFLTDLCQSLFFLPRLPLQHKTIKVAAVWVSRASRCGLIRPDRLRGAELLMSVNVRITHRHTAWFELPHENVPEGRSGSECVMSREQRLPVVRRKG